MPEIAQPLRGCVVHGRGEPHAPFVTLVDLWANAVAAAPDAAAMEDQAGALTYRKVWNAGHAFAARLRGLGAAGRVVAILLPNGGDFHVAYLGALLARATPAPINPGYPPPQVRALLALSKAHTLVTPGPAAPTSRRPASVSSPSTARPSSPRPRPRPSTRRTSTTPPSSSSPAAPPAPPRPSSTLTA